MAGVEAPEVHRSEDRRTAWQRAVDSFFRLPLAGKLAGANLLVAILAWIAVYAVARPVACEVAGGGACITGDWPVIAVLTAALLIGYSLSLLLVALALEPIRAVERTAERVSRGDLDARVVLSPVADRAQVRLARTLNQLLDKLVGDRARMQELAAEIIRVGDRERAVLARELHDSVAQSLAAMQYQVSALEQVARDAEVARRLGVLRGAANSVLEEVRVMSHTVHPRVLDDLGLVAGLRYLARTMTEADGRMSAGSAGTEPADQSSPVDVTIVEGGEQALRAVPPEIGSVLYRVAQEAMRNAMKHSNASHIRVRLGINQRAVWISVSDDGQGFDPSLAERRRPGMGLFMMRERSALVGGRFEVTSAAGRGAHVSATIPLRDHIQPAVQGMRAAGSRG